MNAAISVRALAAQALKRVAIDGSSLRSVLAETSTTIADSRDRALLAAILFESTRWYLRLDAVLDRLMEQPLRRKQPEIHALLIAALAQIEYLGLAEHAAVAASVEAARELKRPHLASLVNAVLRRYLRERNLHNTAIENNPVALSSHPAWLLARMEEDWPQQAAAIVAGNNAAAPLWLRVNARRSSPAQLRQKLSAGGIASEVSATCVDALLAASTDVTVLPGYAQGEFSVQDGAAQLAAELLDLKPGQRVLDACAAPGGKSAHILERADVQLLALDHDPARLPRLRENLGRLGLTAQVRAADAGAPEIWWDGRAFDRILLDAPCSATGIIRRQPDIKLHRRESDLGALMVEQARLLAALWPLLAPGGRLVYATCSLLKDENQQQIAAFLTGRDDARATTLPVDWGVAAGHGRQNFPGQQGMDGFFYAIVDKRA
jgi:16S rRNA (cytosine967-C5)-methyltransferase